jgi:hypothetical protein
MSGDLLIRNKKPTECKQHRSVDADLRMKLESYGRNVKVEVIFM